MFILTFCLCYADEYFFIFKYKQQKFRTISFDLKANRNRGTPA